jgi:hypothetical protein
MNPMGYWSMVAMLACAMMIVAGCSTGPVPTSPAQGQHFEQPTVVFWTGGTPTCAAAIDDGTWLLGMGVDLVHLDTAGRVLAQMQIGNPGIDGGITGLCATERGDVYGVLAGTAVVRIGHDAAGAWAAVKRWNREQIGLNPRRIELIDNAVYVIGTEHLSDSFAVVALGDPRSLRPTPDRPGSLIAGPDGLLVTSGRRAYRLEDGTYVGSASLLYDLPAGHDGTDAAYVFIRNRENGADIGLMNRSLREVQTNRSGPRIDAPVRDAVLIGENMFVITDLDVRVIEQNGAALQQRTRIPRAGVMDVVQVGEDRVAMVGAFGWEIVRLSGRFVRTEGTSTQQDAFAGGIEASRWNGSRLLLSTTAGWWMFDPYQQTLARSGSVDRDASDAPDGHPSQDRVALVGMRASITDERSVVKLDFDVAQRQISQADGADFHCLATLRGRLLCGHDRGIDVYTITNGHAAGADHVSRLRLPGAVRCMYPQVDGRHVLVITDDGGFGILRMP